MNKIRVHNKISLRAVGTTQHDAYIELSRSPVKYRKSKYYLVNFGLEYAIRKNKIGRKTK